MSSIDYKWNPDHVKVRDGRYGPVCSALNETTGKLLNVEIIEQTRDPKAAQTTLLLSQLNNNNSSTNQQRLQRLSTDPHPGFLSLLGFEHRPDDGGLCLLWEWACWTLQEQIQKEDSRPGVEDTVTVGAYLSRLAAGLEALQERGFVPSFVAAPHILVDAYRTTSLKIVPPLFDVAVAAGLGGAVLPPGVLTVPELLGREEQQLVEQVKWDEMPKIDIWLLGIVGAELLLGECLTDTAARQVRAQLQERVLEKQENSDGSDSAWELFVPRHVAEKLDTHAVEFFRQCFVLNPDQRPGVTDLRSNPFLSLAEFENMAGVGV